MSSTVSFTNGRVCYNGELHDRTVHVDLSCGLILGKDAPDMPLEVHDLEGMILAPAYIELQTNGCVGFHFTQYDGSEEYQTHLKRVAEYMVTTGVGSFYATIPTVSEDVFKKVLPQLKPQDFGSNRAELLGAHCEGPFLNPAKKGAHDASLMRDPSNTTPEQIYGSNNLPTIKMVTLAPEISYGTTSLIESLTKDHNIRVSLGHSAASFEDGLTAVSSGATALTHTFNAMEPLNHRSPGLVGLISNAGGGCGIKTPYYSLIADTIHLHYAALVLAFRADPTKCILITDNVELAGLPDGVYPGHAQIPHKQRKVGNKVVIDGTDTLIGSCIGLDECVRNLAHFNGRGNSLAEAVRCVTENVAALMDLTDRGVVEEGRRADFVVLDNAGVVQSVWRAGRKVYEKLRGKGSAEVS